MIFIKLSTCIYINIQDPSKQQSKESDKKPETKSKEPINIPNNATIKYYNNSNNGNSSIETFFVYLNIFLAICIFITL